MSSNATRLAEIALSYEGTPFWKHGRQPGKGLDCAGLVICAVREMGLECPDPDYRLDEFHNHFDLMVHSLAAVFEKVEKPIKRGDVLAIRFSRMPNHMAVYLGDGRMVHAVAGRDVRQTALDHSVLSRIESVWRLK